jgi:structure-specific recognition protein 1
MGWKGEDSAATKSVPSTDMKWVQWLRVARNYQMRVALKDGSRVNFDGFSKEVLVSSKFFLSSFRHSP